MKLERAVLYKETSDDWCESFKGPGKIMLVRVYFMRLHPISDQMWRVCVWGNDDCGMEQDFSCREDARFTFEKVIDMEDVTMSALREIGFISA